MAKNAFENSTIQVHLSTLVVNRVSEQIYTCHLLRTHSNVLKGAEVSVLEFTAVSDGLLRLKRLAVQAGSCG